MTSSMPFDERTAAVDQADIAESSNWVDRLRGLLVNADGLDQIPDPEPLIGDDLVFCDSLNWIVGKPGSMKSFIALDMAGCVGTGERWQGWRVAQGPVLYLVAEGAHGIKKRVRAWAKAMGRQMDNVWFLPMAVQAAHAGQWDGFVELCGELKPIMVVLDTQARITVGIEENSNSEMGRFVAAAERLRQASAAAVFVIHHIGRNGETGRGATTLDGAMSTIIKVSKEDNEVTLTCQKNKDAAEWDDIRLRAVPMGDSIILAPAEGGTRRGSSTDGPSAAALKTARAWWDNHREKWASVSQLVDVVAPKTTFYRHRTELLDAGLVAENRDSRYPTYRLVSSPYPPGVSDGT